MDQTHYKTQIQQLQKEITSIKNEKESVNRMNQILLNKLNELSRRIVEIQSNRLEINNNQCDRDMEIKDLQKVIQKVMDGGGMNQGDVNVDSEDNTGKDCILF